VCATEVEVAQAALDHLREPGSGEMSWAWVETRQPGGLSEIRRTRYRLMGRRSHATDAQQRISDAPGAVRLGG
jgi:hypothetical protein